MNQLDRNLRLYTLGEADDAWIKDNNSLLRQKIADVEKELETTLHQRESSRNLDGERMLIEGVCIQIRGKLESANANHKKLVLSALQTDITVTGQNVKLHLGMEVPDSLALTTGQTSACSPSGSYSWEWEIEYLLLGVTSTGF